MHKDFVVPTLWYCTYISRSDFTSWSHPKGTSNMASTYLSEIVSMCLPMHWCLLCFMSSNLYQVIPSRHWHGPCVQCASLPAEASQLCIVQFAGEKSVHPCSEASTRVRWIISTQPLSYVANLWTPHGVKWAGSHRSRVKQVNSYRAKEPGLHFSI